MPDNWIPTMVGFVIMPVRKWSISVDEKLAEQVELRAGRRGLSGFVARAVANELERDRLDRSHRRAYSGHARRRE